MKQSQIVAIVGMPGAGKSVAASYFKEKGIPVLRFGDETERGLRELGMEVNEKNERWYREKIRKELGMAAMALKIETRIVEAKHSNPFIILDGLYSWEEYVYLKEKFPDLILLCIFAPPEIRYKRLETRSVRPLTQQEAESRDKSEIEQLHKGGPIARADYLIKNESTPQALREGLEKFYLQLL
ncbi:MAG: hypothetical protein ACD_81C00024G0005 [uncultured bacterium]|uniref:Dephospho-CoA kinase n=1 Tax=Candidatus Gottesmanbacteria bacterium RIFCSPLOWO2_01_FULL_43_11b TaxID=1798392 RepID=A0A1F6AHX5_9BACT|nr:MAG: hypothetical protein ACD_81C00024G0005 [uncultured bacterium]OGG24301.1 MAG: hypothetical protein A3A79_03900 [Candidatus Gottesmanbacteria bacterium RIFCSPLOWO2_01_FULL_43_11b]